MKSSKIVDFIENYIPLLKRVTRWGGYVSGGEENVLEHVAKAKMLANIMISLEKRNGAKFDADLVNQAVDWHDHGEVLIGDIRYEVKRDERIAQALMDIEKESFSKMLSGLPDEVRADILVAYGLQFRDDDSFEYKLFMGIERIGYLVYALRQLRLGYYDFIPVLKRQVPASKILAKDLYSVRYMLDSFGEEINYYLTKD